MKNYHLIEDLESLKALDAYLTESGDCPIALDTETTGLEFFSKDIGICISVDCDTGFYLPTRIYNPQTKSLVETSLRPYLKSYIEKWFKKGKRHIVLHNAIFDVRIIHNNFGINLINEVLCDTRILFKMLIDEEDDGALKDLAARYIDPEAANEQTDLKESVIRNGGKWIKENKEFFKADLEPLARYGAKDPCLTLALFEKFYPELQKDAQLWELWNTETIPLMAVIYTMNTKPFHVDIPYFQKLKEQMINEISDLELEILKDLKPLIEDYEEALIQKNTKYARNDHAKSLCNAQGWDIKHLEPDQLIQVKKYVYSQEYGVKSPFKLTSPKSLRWLIYEKLGEPITKKTEKGQPATDVDVIEALAKKYEWAKKLLTKRSNEKLLSTYIETPLEENVDGKVYFDYDQCGTISGRLSTKSGVPIMTLPKTDLRIKRGFIAPKGYKIIGQDWSSLEPHLTAYLSQEPKLIESFVSGKDFYSVIGIEQFGKHDATPYKDGSPNSFAKKYPHLRDVLKTTALGICYGAEDYRVSEILHSEAVNWETRNRYREEAQEFIDSYFKAFPGIKKLIDKSHMRACMYGEIRTKFGRIRHMPIVKELYSKHGSKLKNLDYAKRNGLKEERRIFKNYLNNSVNFCVQGLAAHICSRSMILIQNELKRLGLDAWICSQIHDEILCIAREDQTERVFKIMEDCMKMAVDISPIVLHTEGKIGNDLSECK